MNRPKKIKPKSGQESVWDYPRPPKLESVKKTLTVIAGGEIVARTNRGYRVLETSHPPVYYFPQEDIRMEFVTILSGGNSFCEWKGAAFYADLSVNGQHFPKVAWGYTNPTPGFAPIKNYLAFYAGRVDKCLVNDEVVIPQPGNFYGGWITNDIAGPFKGEPGTWGW